MREFVFRMKLPDGPVDRGMLARLLDELVIWVGEMPEEDGTNLAMRNEDGEVVGFAQLQTLEGDFRYEKA